MDYCPFDDFNAPYTELAISIPLFLILQLYLLYHTLHYECKSYKKHEEITRTKLSIRISYVLLQLSAVYWFINDINRFLLDPFFKYVQKQEIFCGWVAYSPKIIIILYFALYLHQILLRLQLSFRSSTLALSKRTIIMLGIFIIIQALGFPIAFFLLLNADNKPCIWKWKPIDISSSINSEQFAVCDYVNTGWSSLIIGLGVIWIVIVNITIGAIFGVKLNKVLKHSSEDKKSSFKLKSLIIKNTILTAFGSISTLFNWFLWLISAPMTGIGISFLYLDVWLNCLLLALMFKYNENHYKLLCKPCIWCCFIKCDRTYDKQNERELLSQKRRLIRYLEADVGSVIFSGKGSRTESSTNTYRGRKRVHTRSIQSSTNGLTPVTYTKDRDSTLSMQMDTPVGRSRVISITDYTSEGNGSHGLGIPVTMLNPAITLSNESIPEEEINVDKDMDLSECDQAEHTRTNTLRRLAIAPIKMDEILHTPVPNSNGLENSEKMTPFNMSPVISDGGITDESNGRPVMSQNPTQVQTPDNEEGPEVHHHQRMNVEIDLGLDGDEAKDPEIDDNLRVSISINDILDVDAILGDMENIGDVDIADDHRECC